MSVLSRIRNNIGLIAIVIFIALMGFILTDFLSGLNNIFGGPPEAGTVAGRPIPFQEYQERTSLALQRSPGLNEAMEGQIRDDVWTQMVQEVILDQEFKKAGIEISPEELYDMFTGTNISPAVRQYFQPLFEQQGRPFDPETVKRYLEMAQENEESRKEFREFEEYVARDRAQRRYLGMIQAAFTASDAAARRRSADQSRSASITYLAVNYSQIADSLVKVSDDDIRRYLREHEDEFKQDAQTTVRFVKFSLRPDAGDTAKTFGNVQKLRASFAAAQNDSIYTSNKSSTPYSKSFRQIFELPEGVRDSIVRASEKSVIGPVLDRGTFKLFKLVGTQPASEAAAKVAHILIPFGADSATAKTKAGSLAAQARGGDFAQLALDNSDDFNTRSKGGVLGWYRKGTFGTAFDKAVENASAGSVVGPVRGPGGYHIIRVIDKTSLTFDVAEVEQEISYSSSTRDSIYGLANLFVDKLMQTKDINLAAEQMNMPGLNVFETTPPVTAKSRTVTGLQGGRELVLWAINSDEKEISKVFNIGTDYVVAQVVKQQPEGLPSPEDAREQVEVKLLNEKKAELILSKLSGLSGDLNAMSSAYGPGAFVNTAQNVTFESPSIPGIGADKFLIGRVFGLGQGVTSKPIKGLNGVYVIQVSSVTEASEPAPEAVATLKSSMTSTMQGILGSKITPALEEIGDVEDNRAKAEAMSYGYR